MLERAQTYRAQPFWKRTVILLAGIFMNLLFAVLAFVLAFSVIGVDVTMTTGETQHVNLNPLDAIQMGFMVIGVTAQAIVSLFNPQTAADVVSQSTSVVGMAVMSVDFAAMGIGWFIYFMAIISVSLGLMNLLPIPPLDGGRFVIEIFQKLSRRMVGYKAMNAMSLAGMALFLVFFLFMVNQDVQRFVFGNWG